MRAAPGRHPGLAAAGNAFYDTTALIQDRDNPNLYTNADGQVRMTRGGRLATPDRQRETALPPSRSSY